MTGAVVVGAGHNGLVAAILLARAGLDVTVLESAGVVGGACRTETPFVNAPGLRASTGAYLLGLMPPELIETLQLKVPDDLPLVRRDPHYFLPTLDGRHLLLGGDREQARRMFADFFSDTDAEADERLATEIGALRDDLGPAWLADPLPLEDTAERYVRRELREVFTDLVRGSAMDYLNRFGFASETVLAMYAVTDGMPGLTGSPWSPGSGHNFLVHNMCRLPGAGGTWMVVRGGMGTVTQLLARRATEAGVTIRLNTPVERIAVTGGTATGVHTADGDEFPADVVLVATDPFRIPALLGDAAPRWLLDRVSTWTARSPGQTMKVNLALSGLPVFAALPEPKGQHGTTVHLLPPPAADGSVLTALREAFAAATAGRVDATPPLEWYLHSELDPSLRDEHGNHSSALFVQGVPHTPADSDWDTEKPAFVARLLDLVAAYAPGIHDLVVDVNALAPDEIESHFGITGGNIHHVDNAISFTDRMPYRAGVDGVYAGSAGCFPAGSVIGAAGHNAAQAILSDLT
ncbi:MAG: FAD-dependent oxidoreductase [Actinomycetia bacterium]|nr:FAD-dependent oxidoreductase [Actinomycetes bacterium]